MSLVNRVRVAETRDLAALAALRRAAAEEDVPPDERVDDPTYERRFAEWFEAETARTIWLADHPGPPARAIGFVGLLEYRRMPKPGRPDALWGYLGNMFVDPAHRNQGVGAELLRAALAYADERGYVRVVLSPSARAVTLYQRAGFVAADGAQGDHLLVRPGPRG